MSSPGSGYARSMRKRPAPGTFPLSSGNDRTRRQHTPRGGSASNLRHGRGGAMGACPALATVAVLAALGLASVSMYRAGGLLLRRPTSREAVAGSGGSSTPRGGGGDGVNGRIWLAGVILDASEILPDMMRYLVDLTCGEHELRVSVSIVAGSGVDECLARYDEIVRRRFHVGEATRCAPFRVEREPAHVAGLEKRVDRISAARDHQREVLRTSAFAGGLRHDDVVIIADIDLYSLPAVDVIAEELDWVTGGGSMDRGDFDVLCAAGIMYRPYGYYDTFATVLFPDTFVYPTRGRLIRKHYDGEDGSLVRSNEMYGTFTQWDVLDYFEDQSRSLARNATVSAEKKTSEKARDRDRDRDRDSLHPVPVRSCFGGFAIYNATKYLDGRCSYAVPANVTSSLMRYASLRSKVPCEHVVFHRCLEERVGGDPSPTSIAIQPRLRTEWNREVTFGDRLRATNRHEALGVFAKHREEADRLVSGNFTLRINGMGVLVVERWAGNGAAISSASWSTMDPPSPSGEVVWSSAPLSYGGDVDFWTHMYLILKKDGELQLVRQVPMSLLRERRPDLCRSSKIDPCVCDSKTDNCGMVVWSSGTRGGDDRKKGSGGERRTSSSYVLILDVGGHLSVVEEKSKEVLWHS